MSSSLSCAALVAALALALAPAAGGAAPPGESAAPANAAPRSALQLAEQLRALGSNGDCAVEALRHAYQVPEERETGFERAALCLGLAGRHADARRLLLQLPQPVGPLTRYRLCWAEARLDGGPREDCGRVQPGGDRWAALATEMVVLHDLREGHWEAARRRLAAAAASDDPTLASWRAVDAALVERAARRKHRSPWVAGALSAVVPGLGRVYIGRWKDGLMSAILVGLPAGFAANGFSDNGVKSVRGWLLGTMASVLYVGNVYGSAVGAVAADRDADLLLRASADDLHAGRADPAE